MDSAWESFLCDCSNNAEIVFEMQEWTSIDYQVEHTALSEHWERVLRYGSDVLLANRDWNFCAMLPVKDPASFLIFTNQIYYSRVAFCQMLQLHSSLVAWNGRGILFLGPSGIGKTTQAERWAQYRNAEIINGDLVFVQRTEQGYLGWGTPWHGSSPYCLNTSVPVKALVVLKQAPYNALRELTGFEKVSEVSGSVFYPTWVENGMELCLETLNHLLTDLPVYRLDNRADEEAVQLLAAEIDRIS